MTRARSLARLANENVLSVGTDNNVGINSTSPVEKLNVVGVVSATSFYGDGSNLDGVASAGLGTALDPDTAGLDVIYYTDKVLGIGATITIDPPSSTNIAYTQYSEVSVDDGFDIIIADGDEFIPDILGISTAETSIIAGGVGGRIRAGYFTNKAGTGAPQLTFGAEVPVGYGITGAGGINITGVATAASFDGNATTATTATNAQGLTGTPDITVNNITGVAATFNGNVSIAGTLTYEDVTNIDSIGVITARSHLYVAGETRTTTIAEKSTIIDGNTATLTYAGASSNVAICTNPSGNITLNVNGIPTDSAFDNHNLTFAVIVNSTGTARTCTAVNLNGVSKTIKWAGGSLENALSGVTTTNGYAFQSFTGINTVGSASTTDNYTVFGVVSGGFF